MFEQSQVDKLYPGAKIYAPMKFWSLPKNKIHMIEEICENGENTLDRLKRWKLVSIFESCRWDSIFI